MLDTYNSVIGLNYIYDRMKCIFAFDNCSLLDACVECGIKNPNFKDMNHLISQSISTLTSQIRFSNEGSLNNVIDYLGVTAETNIISNSFVNLQDTSSTEFNIKDLFSKKSSLNTVNKADGVSIAMNTSMRGDFSQHHTDSLSKLLKTYNNEQAQYQISRKAPVNIHPTSFQFKNVMHIANNTSSITSYLNNLALQFDKMYSKRAFVHWILGEGFEERGFSEAIDQLYYTTECYSSIKNN